MITARVATIRSGDVVIESGEVNGFEIGLLGRPLLRHVLPDAQRGWVADKYR